MDNMVRSLVHDDDTQLFGEPLVITGEGDTVVPLGAPDNAADLAVAFRCVDPGSFEFHIDGQYAMTVTCDAASGGGGSYFTVDVMAAHTLTVSAATESDSWFGRRGPPGPFL